MTLIFLFSCNFRMYFLIILWKASLRCSDVNNEKSRSWIR